MGARPAVGEPETVAPISTSKPLGFNILQAHFVNRAQPWISEGGRREVGYSTSRLSGLDLLTKARVRNFSWLDAPGAFRIPSASNVYQLITP
jgi:hypothetical protein